jgi:hypothetical protein
MLEPPLLSRKDFDNEKNIKNFILVKKEKMDNVHYANYPITASESIPNACASQPKRSGSELEPTGVKKVRLDILKQNSLHASIPSVLLNFLEIETVPFFHIMLHESCREKLFHTAHEDADLYVRVHEHVLRVIWNDQDSMQEQAWVHFDNFFLNEQNLVTPFDPAQHGAAVEELHLKIFFSPKFKPLVRPFPISISVIEDLCRDTLSGVFFNNQQMFEIIYQKNLPLKVKVVKFFEQTHSLGDVQKIGPKTKVMIKFSKKSGDGSGKTKHQKNDIMEENEKNISKNDFIGAFDTCSSEGRIFSFEIIEFKSLIYSGQEAGRYLIKEWMSNELRRMLPKLQLMRRTALKIIIRAPLKDFIPSVTQVKLSLASVNPMEKGKKGIDDSSSSLYTFDDENYQIDFLAPSQKQNIEILQEIIEISDPVTITILDWNDIRSLSKGGLLVVPFLKEELMTQFKHALKYFSLKKTSIQTELGSFSVEFSVSGNKRADVLYKLVNEQNIILKSEAANLMVLDEQISQDKLWESFLKERLRIKKIGALSSKAIEMMIRFIQTVRLSLIPDALDKNLKPSPVLLISGPHNSGKDHLANFIKNLFSPVIFCSVSSSKPLAVIRNRDQMTFAQVTPQQRGVMLYQEIELHLLEIARNKENRNVILEHLHAAKKTPGMVFIATSSNIKDIPPDIMKEFGTNHIEINTPTSPERIEFLKLLTQEGLSLNGVDFDELTDLTEGLQRRLIYDVVRLANEQVIGNAKKEITIADFKSAIDVVKHSNYSAARSDMYM